MKIQFQGDIAFVEVDSIPSGCTPAKEEDGKFVVAHSETGHHHYVDALSAKVYDSPDDPNVCYLQCETATDVIHARPYDTHKTVKLQSGAIYMGVRQVEYTPEGWRRAAD